MYENLPDKLKLDARFCLWRYEERNGKMTKVPYQTNGRRADSADKNTFADFRLAMAAVKDYSGIGMGLFDDFSAIDIDHCVYDGKLTEMAQNIADVMDSYTELSPSGTGIRIICTAKGLSYDKHRYYINNRKIGLQVYVAGYTHKFVTLTGNVIRKQDVEERSEQLVSILEKHMVRPAGKKKPVSAIPGSYLSDESVIAKASGSRQGEKFKALWNGSTDGFGSHSEADLALCTILAFWCGGEYRADGRAVSQVRTVPRQVGA